MDLNIIEIILLFLILYLLGITSKLEGQVKGLKYTLIQLLETTDPVDYPINNELRELIQEGKEIKAVKKVRETLGLSLLEAKQYIDALKREERS